MLQAEDGWLMLTLVFVYHLYSELVIENAPGGFICRYQKIMV